MGLWMRENCVLALSVNILIVWHAGLLGHMTCYHVFWWLATNTWGSQAIKRISYRKRRPALRYAPRANPGLEKSTLGKGKVTVLFEFTPWDSLLMLSLFWYLIHNFLVLHPLLEICNTQCNYFDLHACTHIAIIYLNHYYKINTLPYMDNKL